MHERFHGAKVRDDLGVMGAIMPRRGHLTVPALPKMGAGMNEGEAEGRERCSLNLNRGR